MWLKLKSGKDTLFLADIELSAQHKVFAVPGVDFSFNGKNGPYFRLSFALLPREILEEVCRIIVLQPIVVFLLFSPDPDEARNSYLVSSAQGKVAFYFKLVMNADW